MKRSLLIKPTMEGDYPYVSHGDGIYLYDRTGKEYIDGSSGAVTASIGHAVPEIIDAMVEQARNVSFVYRSQFTSYPAEALASKLNELMLAEEMYYSFFVNSGSEANETAMKIAIQHFQERGLPKKNTILSRWVSYHGITLGALSMSGHVMRRQRFVSLLKDYPTVSPPYCYRCPFSKSYPSCELMCASEVETAIRRIGAEHIAAFIAEPLIGAAGGVIVPPEGYYEKISNICRKYDILFIVDEVMTGIGRTGKMFGFEHWEVSPDLVTLGKGMSAGYAPIAATLVSERVMEPILAGSKSVMSGHTYSANPQSARVALEVIRYIETHQLVKKSAELGDYLYQRLKKSAEDHPIIGDVRGKGLLIGIEFVANYSSKSTFNKNITNLLINKAMEKGLLLYPAASGKDGIDGDAIILAPPLVITKEELDQLLVLFEETIIDVEKELAKSL